MLILFLSNRAFKPFDLRNAGKGQTALEFMILTGVLFFFLLGFLAAVRWQQSDDLYEKRNNVAKEVAFTVQQEINLAASSRDGYERNFTLPKDILNLEYCVRAAEGNVYVRTEDGRHALSLPLPRDFSGSVGSGVNIVRRQAGVITINATEPLPCT